MFGKPNWFRPKTIAWGLVPITWQGWAYAAGWAAAIALPFLLLAARHQALEATTWMSLALAALTLDVWQIRRAISGPGRKPAAAPAVVAQRKHDGILYISESK